MKIHEIISENYEVDESKAGLVRRALGALEKKSFGKIVRPDNIKKGKWAKMAANGDDLGKIGSVRMGFKLTQGVMTAYNMYEIGSIVNTYLNRVNMREQELKDGTISKQEFDQARQHYFALMVTQVGSWVAYKGITRVGVWPIRGLLKILGKENSTWRNMYTFFGMADSAVGGAILTAVQNPDIQKRIAQLLLLPLIPWIEDSEIERYLGGVPLGVWEKTKELITGDKSYTSPFNDPNDLKYPKPSTNKDVDDTSTGTPAARPSLDDLTPQSYKQGFRV